MVSPTHRCRQKAEQVGLSQADPQDTMGGHWDIVRLVRGAREDCEQRGDRTNVLYEVLNGTAGEQTRFMVCGEQGARGDTGEQI